MGELSEVETILASLVDAVVSGSGLHEEVEVFPVGGYLWKFPSEGSNESFNSKIRPPPVPQIREYPRKCAQCGACWVSDREREMDHLRDCSVVRDVDNPEATKQKAANLGVARRVWCEVDESFSRLQWRHDREQNREDNVAANFIAFGDITEVSMLDEPANSFQVVTHGQRTIVFQQRRESDQLNAASDLVPYRLELDARQWQEYLDELSKYARNSQLDKPMSPLACEDFSKKDGKSVAAVFEEVSLLLLNAEVSSGMLATRLHLILEKFGYDSQWWSLCDDDGSSFVHLAIGLHLRNRTTAVVSTLLGMSVDCNMQNQEGESPLLLVAASGDIATANVLLASPSIQVDLPCALGVTAFHVAANAGDTKMMQLLCDAGAQPEKRDENGWTALHYAAACSTGLEALHFLCELLIDEFIDAQCSEGNTALHVAAGCGCLENVRALLETAASPHICNFSGESAYHLALRNNHIQCAVCINDYQSMPPTCYTKPPSHSTKTSAVSEATTVVPNWRAVHGEAGEWVEAFTEDGYTYYYNAATGESSWYKPGEYQPENEERNSYIYDERSSENDMGHSYTLADHDAGSILEDGFGQQLPLCLIPMVSPLTSLDNPTAAAKYEAARRRARKKRQRRQSKLLPTETTMNMSSLDG